MAIFFSPNPSSQPAGNSTTGAASPFILPVQAGDYYVDKNNSPLGPAGTSALAGKTTVSWLKYVKTPTIASGGPAGAAPTINATASVTTPITIAAGATSDTIIKVYGGAAFYTKSSPLVLYNITSSPVLPAGLTLVPVNTVSTFNNQLYNAASYTLQASSSFVAPTVSTAYTITFTDSQGQTGSVTVTLAAGAGGTVAAVPKPTATGSTALVTLYTSTAIPATPALQPVTATGGTAPLKFTATLPAGLSMDSTGVITEIGRAHV